MEPRDIGALTRDDVLADIMERLIEAFRPLEIYLFGSRARNESGPQSDYDLVLIMPDDAAPELLDPRKACQVLSGTGIAADVLIWPRSYFEQYSVLRASLPGTVKREGRLLYAA